MEAQEFELLLARLDADRDLAGQKYERLREALIVYFEHRGSLSPAEHADRVFDIVGSNLKKGKEIYLADPAGYFYGVAGKIVLQLRREGSYKFVPIEELETAGPGSAKFYKSITPKTEDPDKAKRHDCLDECLVELSAENRLLIHKYYVGEASIKINNRKELAESLGISLGVLRLRAFRIRKRIETCVEECVGTSEMKSDALPS